MTDLIFTQNPTSRKPLPLFWGTHRSFLRLSTVQIVSNYSIRTLTFSDPSVSYRSYTIERGDYGLYPLNFQSGTIGLMREPRQLLHLTSSPTHQFLDGRVTLTSTTNLGSLGKFAIWAAGQPDPAVTYVETATNDASGAVAANSTRHSAVFVPHPDARYLGVGARVYSMPNTGTNRNQYFKKWMVEKAPQGATLPSAVYGKAREVKVSVRPDRLNLVQNPSAETNASAWSLLTVGATSRSSTHAHHGTYSLRLAPSASGDMVVTTNLDNVRGGRTYSASAWVRGDDTATASMYFIFYDSLGAVLDQTDPEPNRGRPRSNVWVRLYHYNKMAPAGTYYAELVVTWAGTNSGSFYYLDEVIAEETAEIPEYFDGATSGDTIWEKDGVAGASRSYLYKNRADRYDAIKRVLRENVPMGIGIAEPVFGTLPPLD